MSETALQPEQEPASAPPGEFSDDLIGPHPLDRREAAIEEAAATRREELREDGFDIPPEDAAEAEADDGETPKPEGDSREPLPGEPLYTVKVDGQERQVPLSELTASYVTPGDARTHLEEASQTLRRAREIEQGVLSRATAAPGSAARQQPRDELDGIDWNGVAEKLQYGEKDDAGNALKDLVVQLRDRGRGPAGVGATPEQVELRVMEKIEWTTALNRFGEDYQDILQDPHVAGIAGSMGRALYQQSLQDSQVNGTPRRPYWDIFREAGEKTREWRNGLAGQEADPSRPAVNLSKERGVRKRAAPQPPTARSGRPLVPAGVTGRGKAPKSDGERYSEGIADIQRGRGQR